jgi:type IX secretion system PorP/SprF family membrane protein
MKNILAWLFITGCSVAGFSQQPAQYSLYMLNKYAFNPAYAGMDNSLSLTGVYRNQWTGLDGNPVTQNLNAHMPLYIAGGGIGVGMENESLGSWKQTAFSLSYAYQAQVGKSGILSMGAGAGLVQRQLDGKKVKTPGTIFDDEERPIEHQDPYLDTRIESGAGPTAHAGIFYQGEKLEIGISAINILGNELNLSGLNYEQERTWFLYTGYRFDLGRNLTVHPSILVKSDIWQTQTDFSVLARYQENIFLGASFRGYNSESVDAMVLTGGLKLSEKISLAYAYDIGLSNLNNTNKGSHELLLNYNLGKPIGKGRPPIIIYNPRSL